MTSRVPAHLLDPFLAAADATAAERPEVDLEVARELMAEAAGMLHDGLVLDDLDAHDLPLVVAALASDLVAPDPGAAMRAREAAVAADEGRFHDPDLVRGAYLVAISTLRL